MILVVHVDKKFSFYPDQLALTNLQIPYKEMDRAPNFCRKRLLNVPT